MSYQSLSKAAYECFAKSMSEVLTREENEAAIVVWNELLDDAITNAIRAKYRYVEGKRYEHACIARDMAEHFQAMKATKYTPFRPAT